MILMEVSARLELITIPFTQLQTLTHSNYLRLLATTCLLAYLRLSVPIQLCSCDARIRSQVLLPERENGKRVAISEILNDKSSIS